jgi:hypothetical protein
MRNICLSLSLIKTLQREGYLCEMGEIGTVVAVLPKNKILLRCYAVSPGK